MKVLLIHNSYKYKGGEDSVFDNESTLLTDNGVTIEKLTFHNTEIIGIFQKILVGFNVLFNLKVYKKLKKNIEIFNPDVIHVHNFFPIVSPAVFFVAKHYNIPIIMTLHNYRLICANALLFRENKVCELCIKKTIPFPAIKNKCYRESRIQTIVLVLMTTFHKIIGTWKSKVNIYIALTNFAKVKILNSSLNLHPEQIKIKQNFVEDRGYDFQKDDYFLFVGRLSKEKGIEILLDSFSNNNQKLIIIGDGPMKKEVMETVLNNKNIMYLGFQDLDIINQYMRKAKALIFTSIWYEGMPMTILEALSAGTPVIAPNIGAASEIIKNGFNGLIYEVGNSHDLKKKIKNIDINEEKYQQVVKNSREDFEKNYSKNINFKLLIKIYQEAIK